MRKVFLCHATEDKALAERIQLALATGGYDVFFDQQSLNAGDDFDGTIHRAILACDAFLFLATASSVAKGKYTLTELKLIRQRWSSPAGRVLTVNVGGLPPSELPPYLAAATVLEATGNVAAEVRVAIDILLEGQRSLDRILRHRAIYGAATAALLAVGGALFYPHAQKGLLGANARLGEFGPKWISENDDYVIADGWRSFRLKVPHVRFKDRHVVLALSRGSTASEVRVDLRSPKTTMIDGREYRFFMDDVSDVAVGDDQARLTITRVQ
jgi:hypothetical protein